jgi:general secretion pathway protein G
MILKSRKGFTIIELLIVIAVIAILIGIALPKFKGMRDEGNIAKAKGELRTLQTAVESYKIHTNSYPTALGNLNANTTVPNIIGSTLPYDPFGATSTTNYGYSANGSYYVIYSIGVNGNGTASVDNASGNVTAANNSIYVSNGTPGSGG